MQDAPTVMVGGISSNRGGMITVAASGMATAGASVMIIAVANRVNMAVASGVNMAVGDRQGVISKRGTPTSDGRQSSPPDSERRGRILILAPLLELVDSSEV